MNPKIPAGEKLTIGLDLGDRRHHACVLDASGEILAEEGRIFVLGQHRTGPTVGRRPLAAT